VGSGGGAMKDGPKGGEKKKQKKQKIPLESPIGKKKLQRETRRRKPRSGRKVPGTIEESQKMGGEVLLKKGEKKAREIVLAGGKKRKSTWAGNQERERGKKKGGADFFRTRGGKTETTQNEEKPYLPRA